MTPLRRRTFVATSAAGLAALPTAAHSQSVQNTMYDFIIIGAGTAGLPAAIFASRRGAKVLLMDAAEKIGGTLNLANGQVAAAGTRTQLAKGITHDTPDAHYGDIMALSRGFADANVARRTADLAPGTLNWLLDNGLKPLPDHPVTGDSPGRPAYKIPRYIWGEGQGRDILKVVERQLAPELASGRVVTQLSTRATGFIASSSGAVEGVRATHNGQSLEFRGRNVLLTTGGYAMNPKLFQDLIGQPSYASGSWPQAQGDGLGMVSAIGGSLRGADLHRAGSGSILTGDRFPAKPYARFVTAPQDRQPWEIWVNDKGQRFVAEDEPLTYVREREIVKQSKFKYFIVFDQAIFGAAPPGVAGWTREKMAEHFNTHPMFAKADTLDALANALKVDASGLRATAASYNAAVKGGSDQFGRKHMPRVIETGPFYAITHLGTSATSSVGVVIDKDLRVLRADGSIVPNLYAAGEVLGSGATLGNAFVPGMMLTPALTLGRWLGETLPVGS
ncbi:MAG: FAD-binding protein [Rhodospirillaceae bacterium]|nr:FAD-binding protein [Rhodospirillaceae bacterium]